MRLRLFDHMMHAVFERRRLRRAARCRLYTPRAATRVAVAFRTAHLHCGPIARTKFECAFDARIIARGKFSAFSDPQNLGGGPAPGFAVLQLGLVWQAKQAVAETEAEKVRSSPALDGFGLRRNASDTRSCAEWRHPSHSHRGALCRIPHHANACARAYSRGEGGCVYVRIAVVADSLTPLRARQCGRAGSVM